MENVLLIHPDVTGFAATAIARTPLACSRLKAEIESILSYDVHGQAKRQSGQKGYAAERWSSSTFLITASGAFSPVQSSNWTTAWLMNISMPEMVVQPAASAS